MYQGKLGAEPRQAHHAQEIAAKIVHVIYTTLSERLSAVRIVFGNLTSTLYALWDTR